MEPIPSREEFESHLRRIGLLMGEEEKSELFHGYSLIRTMAVRVRSVPRDREAEPAHVFTFGRDVVP